jgi:hypothetical protein
MLTDAMLITLQHGVVIFDLTTLSVKQTLIKFLNIRMSFIEVYFKSSYLRKSYLKEEILPLI